MKTDRRYSPKFNSERGIPGKVAGDAFVTAQFEWLNTTGVPSQSYTCWHCGLPLASEKGWQARDVTTGQIGAFVCICHRCSRPTFVEVGGRQTPGVPFGEPAGSVSDAGVEALYEEARKATSVGSHTTAVLACRKLLMHIAVAKGAPEEQPFVKYVEYLAANHYVPPDAREWVDHIRKRGNEANHEIQIMSKEDAEELLTFSSMLLKLIYEFPAAIKRRSRP